MSHDQIIFKYSACGSATFSQPNEPQPDDLITRTGCGAVGHYGDVQAAAIEVAKSELDKAVKETFGGLKGWKIGK